eukprot:4290588-Heterocapsa_arctica.AAC.1
MDRVEGNKYTIARQGAYTEHPIDVEATIVESILGMGEIYAAHGFTELEDIPELVVAIERGLRMHKRSTMPFVA